MTLQEYLKLKKLTITAMAKTVGISRSHLNNILKGSRRASTDIAKKIELATDGNVTRYQLLWPEDFQ